jgi:hypothetical protein
VPEAVEAHARGEPPEQLGFRRAVSAPDTAGQLGIARLRRALRLRRHGDQHSARAHLSKRRCDGERDRYTVRTAIGLPLSNRFVPHINRNEPRFAGCHIHGASERLIVRMSEDQGMATR